MSAEPNQFARNVWAAFAEQEGLPDTPYQAWAFGADPDGLAELVVRGVKTATSSAYPVYELEEEPLPEVGSYHIILDADERPMCIIQITKVEVKPFCEVDATHAWKEGEGDRTLAHWQAVHRTFFREESTVLGYTFTDQMPVVCETFKVVFVLHHC